jgi:hypothetical protein
MIRSAVHRIAALALANPAVYAADCGTLKPLADALVEPRSTLTAAMANSELDTDLAPATSDAIVSLKRQLIALVDAAAACTAPAATNAKALESALTAAVGKNDDATIGFGVTPFDGKRLGVVAEVGIPCGRDALWLVYEADGERWRRALTAVSPRYARVDGAWGSFQAAVSPRGADGRWFAAIAHIRPWCTSTWSTIDYAALRPGPNADVPLVVLKGSESLWWGNDDLGRLTVDADHVELRYRGASIDTGVHNREYVRRYAIDGMSAKRVAPFAASPRDFVEEWIITPWSQASAWSTDAKTLEAAHAKLQAARKAYEPVEFGATTTCAHDTDATQIELKRDDGAASTFFRVTGKSDYAMAAISDAGDPDCVTAAPEAATP